MASAGTCFKAHLGGWPAFDGIAIGPVALEKGRRDGVRSITWSLVSDPHLDVSHDGDGGLVQARYQFDLEAPAGDFDAVAAVHRQLVVAFRGWRDWRSDEHGTVEVFSCLPAGGSRDLGIDETTGRARRAVDFFTTYREELP